MSRPEKVTATGCSGPYRAPKVFTATELHYQALRMPDEKELPLIRAVNSVQTLATLFGSDYVGREGVAQMILGLIRILDFDWGNRIQRGMIHADLIRIAGTIDYDTEREEFLA